MPKPKDNLHHIIKSIFEARYLKRIKRSGTSVFLGPEVDETVVEHSYYCSLIGIVFHNLEPKLDLGKLLSMCLIHDLEEVRTGDMHLVNRLYMKKREVSWKAFGDMWSGSTLGNELTELHKEWEDGSTEVAKAANDCSILAELITEKEYLELGTEEAEEWMTFTIQRLKTMTGKQIASEIQKSRMTEWWEDIKNEIRKKQGVKAKKYG